MPVIPGFFIKYRLALLFASLAVCLSACSAVVTATPTPSPAAVLLPPSLPADTPTAPATATPLSPTAADTATATATALPTLTPTPTLFPMDIRAARQTPYPGSDIVIQETLDPGTNYYRYYAYYLSEGLKIYGLLTVPYAAKPETGYPAIVFNHGYIQPEVYRTTGRYIAYVDGLARQGYVVFKIDYRGNDRSEGQPLGAYSDPGYEVDVLNAVASLERYPLVDPQRIGMWGHSMGGYLTLRAMVISPDIRAGVIWSGVVAPYPEMMCCWRDPFYSTPTPNPTPNPRRGWRQWLDQYGSPQDNPAFWNSISANSYLKDISGPLQLQASTADQEVPYSFSLDLYQEMVNLGLPAEYYQYDDDNHNLSVNFNLAMSRTLEFFDTYLKNAPRP